MARCDDLGDSGVRFATETLTGSLGSAICFITDRSQFLSVGRAYTLFILFKAE